MSKRKTLDVLEYQTKKFFKGSIINPQDSKYYSKHYFYINIAIDQLDVYKNLRNKYNDKIEIKSSNISQKYTDDQICKYVFMRLFRSLFYFDFVHDFGDTKRDGNNLYKGLSKEEKKQKRVEIIKIYQNVYEKDILDIYRFIFNEDNETKYSKVKDFDKNIILKNTKIKIQETFNESEDVIKEKVLNIIKYLDIEPVNVIDNINNCGQTFDDIINNINDYSTNKINIELFVDADKSKFSLYPILNQICSLLFINFTNIKTINYNKSILDKYDGASSSSLLSIIRNLKENVYPNNVNINKINNIDLPFSTIKMIFKLNENDEYEDRFIQLNFQKKKDDSVTLNIDRFFTLYEEEKEQNLSNSTVSSTSFLMNNTLEYINSKKLDQKTLEQNYANFVLQSYFKTMGDFSQIILVHQLSKINKDNLYLFLSFDKIASYISSLFNAGTLKEENENPLLPLKFFKRNFISSTKKSSSIFDYIYINNYFKKFKTSFGKINNKNQKLERIIKLADKYNVSYKNLTYAKLYEKLHKLYKLQLLAKKLKIPITYTKQIKMNNKIKNKRFYKTSKILINEIKKKNKNFN